MEEKKRNYIVEIAVIFVCVIIIGGCATATNVYGGPTTVVNGIDEGQSISDLEKKVSSAAALLYAQDEEGRMRMFCTATAFERIKNVYHFVTAAHCVAEDCLGKVEVEKSFSWFVSFDEIGIKKFYSAKLLGVGYQSRGDDFAVLKVTLDREIPTIPMANSDAEVGERVVNVASPLGLGKQLFRGHVTMRHLDRPVIGDGINWTGATMLQISSGPGSSGSSVVSQNRKAVISILVGGITYGSSKFIVSIPVTKFNSFWKKVKDNKYPWYTPSVDLNGLPSAQCNGSKFMNRIEHGITVDIQP